MDRTRTSSPGVGAAAGAFDARHEAQLPVRIADRAGVAPGKTRVRRSWLGIGIRIVRDAAVAVAFMALVPIAIIGVKGENAWGRGNFGNSIRAKLALSDASRSVMLPKDPSITPMQAGVAFNALQPRREAGAFPVIEPVSRPEHSWETATLTAEMFVNGTMTFGFHGPSSASILEAVAKGFTPQETAFLRTLATAPVWREFDMVARAPAVDILGGWLKVPFPGNVAADQMPIPSLKTTKELAYAAVSRAAYHMSIGQRDSAETVLRSIVSFGFAVMDNGHTNIDEVMGAIIVGVGRDALRRFYVITNDPRSTLRALAPTRASAGVQEYRRLPLGQMRQLLIAEAADPREHLGMRFEALRLLSASSCTNVKELLFGNGSDVIGAFQHARRDLARYPSEQALVDLLVEPPQPRFGDIKYDPFQALAVSSAMVAGIVVRNPRLAACTRIVTGYYGGPW